MKRIITLTLLLTAATLYAGDTNVATVSPANCKTALSQLSPEAQAWVAEYLRLNNGAVRRLPGYGVATNTVDGVQVVTTNHVRLTYAAALAEVMAAEKVSRVIKAQCEQRCAEINGQNGKSVAASATDTWSAED